MGFELNCNKDKLKLFLLLSFEWMAWHPATTISIHCIFTPTLLSVPCNDSTEAYTKRPIHRPFFPQCIRMMTREDSFIAAVVVGFNRKGVCQNQYKSQHKLLIAIYMLCSGSNW